MEKLNWKQVDPSKVFKEYRKHTTWQTAPSMFMMDMVDYLTMIGVPQDAASEFGSEIIDQWNGEAIEKNEDAMKELVFKTKEMTCQKK